MSLIIDMKTVYKGENAPAECSPVRITLEKKYLSLPYNLDSDDKIIGEVNGIYNRFGVPITTPGFKIAIMFKLFSANVTTDSLYITKDTWAVLRDYGVIPDDTMIGVKIIEVESHGVKTKIYPHRDISS